MGWSQLNNCKNSDSLYRKYIKKGEIKYVAANFWTDLGSDFRITN